MKIKNNKYLKYSVSLLILFSVLFQFWHLNHSYHKFISLKSKLKIQRQKNSLLKAEYKESLNNQQKVEKLILKKQTPVILAQAESLGLKLIDFSSSEAELNLNFTGNFHSTLKLFYYLEANFKKIKIAEFKIKRNSQDLFLFVKLRDERV